MARVTVEDCVLKVPNRFELVLHAAQRARNISRGEELTIERDNDKNPVVALREIAESTVDLDLLQADLIKSLQRAPEPEPAEEEVLDLIATDENIFGVMDVNEEPTGDGAGLEDLSADEIEGAILARGGGEGGTGGGGDGGWRPQPRHGGPGPAGPPRQHPAPGHTHAGRG